MKNSNYIKLVFLIVLSLAFYNDATAQETTYFNVGYIGTISNNSMTLTQKVNGKNFNFKFFDASNNNVTGTVTYQNALGATVSMSGLISKKQKTGSTLTALYFVDNATTTSYLFIVPTHESKFNTTTLQSQGLDESGINSALLELSSTQSTLPVATFTNPTVLQNAGYAVFILSITNLNTGSWNYSIKPTLGNSSAILGTDYTSTGLLYSENGTTWSSFTYGNKISFTNDSLQIKVPIINQNTSLTNKEFYLTSDTITATSGAAVLNKFGIYGTGTILVPTITTSGTLSAFSTCNGNASTAQNFTVSGTNLIANVVVTAPTGYELATTLGGTYTSSISLVPTANTLTNSPVYVRLSASAINGASGNITFSSTNSAYTPTIATGTATVHAPPTISVQPASVKILTGNPINLTITATGVSAYVWKKNGTVISEATNNSHTIAAAELSDAGSYTVTLSGTNIACAKVTSTVSVVAVTDTLYSKYYGSITNLEIWGVETDGSGNQPTSFINRTSHVYQLRNRSWNMVSLDRNFTIAGTLDLLNTELTVALGYNLQAGKITRTSGGTGVLFTAGNSSIVLTGVAGATSQLYFKTESFLKDLTLNAAAPANLNSALSIVDSGTVICGALFSTNNYLTLKSTVDGDASVGLGSESGGYITGNVNLERYIGASRDWRLIGFPFSGDLMANTISPFFTSNLVCYWYDESLDDGKYGNSGPGNAGWVPFSGTATTPYSKGLLLLGGNNSTINISNALKTGTQTFSLGYSTGRPNRGWHLVANPFASKLDWDVIVSLQANKGQKIAKAIYRWDPAAQGYASYINGFAAGRQSNIIENGSSFFVSLSEASVLTISESSKTNTTPAGRLFAVPEKGQIKNFSNDAAAQSIIKLHLYKQGETLTDQVIVRWGNAADVTDAFDVNYDAYDMGRKVGPDLGLLGSDNVVYSIFHGSKLKNFNEENRALALNTNSLEEGNVYEIKTELLSPLAGGNKAYIYDKYTKEYTAIESIVKAYSFQVTNDTLSKSATRFLLVFNKQKGAALEENNSIVKNGFKLMENPLRGNNIRLLAGNDYSRVAWQIMDNSGRMIHSGYLNEVKKGTIYAINASKEINSGVYLIRLSGDSQALPTLRFIK